MFSDAPMSTCTLNNRDGDSYPTGYNSCWEWVASLPGDRDAATLNADCGSTNEPILAGSGFITRKRGIQGLSNGVKHSAADIYQLALATRKARERLSVVSSSADGPGERMQDRAMMLRTAFAAQRLDRTASEGTYSFDSSTIDPFGMYDEEDSFPSAEELLIQLGFGGPSQGLDRVPERFLQSSQVRGVDIEHFFATQQEMNDTFETGSLGYRGLTGPPTRRPSGIVARLYERMLRKSSGPTTSSSFENPSLGPNVDCLPSLTLELKSNPIEMESDENAITPTNQPPFNQLNHTPLMAVNDRGSCKSSLASSRRSSLRRQDCVDLDEPMILEPAGEICQQSEQSSGFISGRLMANASQLPTVYVTPPPSTIFSQASLDLPESVTTHEIDPIIAVLQLAAEAYRVRLNHPTTQPVEDNERCDWNHNLQDVKDELVRELDKTDDLLQRLQQRLSHSRSSQQSYDSSGMRSVLADMTTLLQMQQRLYRRVNDFEDSHVDDVDANQIHLPDIGEPQPQQSSLLTASANVSPSCSAGSDHNHVDSNNSLWWTSFERRMTAQIRKTVRQELRRVRPVLTLRSKLKKSY